MIDLLAHFEGVRSVGPDRWMAKKNADQRTGSVSLRRLPDGRWLVHDFSGDSTIDLLEARGLDISALFPDPLPDDRNRRPRETRPLHPADALRSIAHDIDRACLLILVARQVELADLHRTELFECAARVRSALRACGIRERA